MSITRGDLVDLIELALSDSSNATFAEATVQDWLEEAIRAYSAHFPRVQSSTLNCSAGVHYYTVSDDTIDLVKVEYPKGEDPPEFLKPLTRKSPNFWDSDDYYDFEPDYEGEGTLWISASPAATDTIEVTYLAHHATSYAQDSSYITVPEEHVPILVAYCVWKGFQEVLAAEQQSPDTTIHLIRDMTQQVQAAYAQYERLLDRAKETAGRSAITQGWIMDDYDPIY